MLRIILVVLFSQKLAISSTEQCSSANASSLLQVHKAKGTQALKMKSKDVDCSGQAREMVPDESFQWGSLHDVVGQDGVLVISLIRKNARFDYSAAKLRQAGVWPTEFAAADVECLSEEELSHGCLKGDAENSNVNEQACQGRAGGGCAYVNEQAVAESHRRALTAASEREKEWTAILEDDVVPVRPETWNEAFSKAWQQVPGHVKLVRLSWCQFPGDNPGSTLGQDTYSDTGEFYIYNWTGYEPGRHYNPGLCTSAYMVHRDIIPQMLQLFPCCCAVDCCLLYDFMAKGWEQDAPQGLQFMMHLDAKGSTEYAKGFHLPWVTQMGVLVQDARDVPSTAWWENTIESVDNPVLKSDNNNNAAA